MNMQDHILAALREQLDRWQALLDSLSVEQITTPQFGRNWSIKDVVVHLWAWQQMSVARMHGGVLSREPEFPYWVTELGGEWEENSDRTNERINEIYHEMTWSNVYRNWKENFLQFLKLGESIQEKELLDADRYPWLNGYSLSFVLVASYDHHQEHFVKLLA